MLVNSAFKKFLYMYKNLFLLSNRFGGLFQGFQEIPRNSASETPVAMSSILSLYSLINSFNIIQSF